MKIEKLDKGVETAVDRQVSQRRRRDEIFWKKIEEAGISSDVARNVLNISNQAFVEVKREYAEEKELFELIEHTSYSHFTSKDNTWQLFILYDFDLIISRHFENRKVRIWRINNSQSLIGQCSGGEFINPSPIFDMVRDYWETEYKE